jgi:hypothetical protein
MGTKIYVSIKIQGQDTLLRVPMHMVFDDAAVRNYIINVYGYDAPKVGQKPDVYVNCDPSDNPYA